MNKSKDIMIKSSLNIQDALIKLTKTRKKHLICIDESDKLIGLVTDGDIRRHLLDNGDINEPIELACNKEPVFVTNKTSQEEVEQRLSIRIRIIPVVDVENKVIGYYSFDDIGDSGSIKNKSIAILGMGYVGTTLGVVLADCGFRVYGFDIDEDLIATLIRGDMPFYEEGLQRYLHLYGNKTLKFTTDIEQAKSDVYMITVGTPLKPDKNDENRNYIKVAAEAIGKVIEEGNTVILRSTVSVGCSREVVKKAIEDISGLECGKDFYLAFAPERTAEGVALKELRRNPQIIGAYDQSSFDITARIFNSITHSVIDVGSLEAAELAKLIDNNFRYHIFAFSNCMAMLAEDLGLNVHNIIDAVNFNYSRNMVPKPSPGVGGPCLSKDPYILKNVLKRHGINTGLISAAQDINEHGPKAVKNKLDSLLKQIGKDSKTVQKISVIGLAFKGDPETSDLRESTSLWFLDQFENKKNIYGYDPVVAGEEIQKLGIMPVSLEDAFKDADAVVILNLHKSYAKWPLDNFLATMNKPSVVIDTWYNFSPFFFKRQKGIFYGGLGNV